MRSILVAGVALICASTLAGPAGARPAAETQGHGAVVATTAPEQHGSATQHEPDEHGVAEHEAKPWWDLPARLTNFALLLGLLYWLLVLPPPFVVQNFDFPGLKVILADRSRGIVTARKLAADQTQSAARIDADSAQRLSQLQQETAALVQEARAAATRERQRLEADAVDEAQRIRDGAAQDLKAEIGRARRSLQLQVADLVVGVARRLVEDNVTEEDQARLVHQYLERLGGTAS